ncbi:PBP1A family penicillin-binding protein [Methylobacterium dankookense]|uniref:Biosynthetic peptidoglycan transglycosylase n=1 Tax=Methylobacterium dankookense TaxID=560405 RepID=A0A564FS21_9HYPH|nr:PBP1A family penicillin-binding protein [Methylobacterium dankookense]GJD56566.1 Biosynthetic peptidoglycan transglycosylase [Methylobacterium dankookense]VUF10965.1 Penicillin-binding protein 2D [Methylobacterium dankookense]
MSPPDPERAKLDGRGPDPDTRAAAREAASAARQLGRQLAILLAGSVRWAARSSGRAAAGGAERLGGLRRRLARPASSAPSPDSAPARSAAPPPRRPGRWRRAAFALVALVAVPLLALLGYVLAAFLTLPPLGSVTTDPGSRALTVEADDGRVFATRGVFRGQPLTAADLPPHLAQAIVAIEDRRFYSHWGVDLRGLARAAWRNALGGGVREGGSTITQQYVRLTSLSQEKTLRRKIQEAFLALRAESEMTKSDILLGYLNTAYFGAGAYGVDAAARRYFGKPAKQVSLPEAAMLAGLVRAPSQLAPTRNFGGAKERADVVLQAMVETGAITAKEADAARTKTVTLRTPPETPPGANYFLDLVAADAKRLADTGGDVTVRATLNLDLQSLAEGVIARRLDAEGQKKKASQAALVALSPQGAILAMVGGRDYEDSQFNRAVQAKRQAGSLFKLFVYLTAYSQGLSPDSMLVDRPVQIGDWEPQNSNNRFRGALPLRTAFALSVNTIAAQLGDELGIPAVIATARKLGITSDLPNVPSLALGSAEVTLLEMTRAYAGVLANRTPLETFSIHAIRGAQPQPLYLHPDPAQTGGLSADSRSMMLDSLQAVVDGGTGKAARVPGLAVGGKTGTTQDYRDAWFIGMTPDLVVGIWVGNDDNSSMNRVGGGDLPAAMFRDFVQRASAQLAKGRKRPSAARAEPAPAVQAGAQPTVQPGIQPPAPVPVEASAEARGVPEVIDTGTLSFRGRVVRLAGVEGEGGALARQLARYLRRREVVCATVSDGMRCRIEGDDLAALILAAGGARASESAPPDLLAAEEQARAERVGLWGRDR